MDELTTDSGGELTGKGTFDGLGWAPDCCWGLTRPRKRAKREGRQRREIAMGYKSEHNEVNTRDDEKKIRLDESLTFDVLRALAVGKLRAGL